MSWGFEPRSTWYAVCASGRSKRKEEKEEKKRKETSRIKEERAKRQREKIVLNAVQSAGDDRGLLDEREVREEGDRRCRRSRDPFPARRQEESDSLPGDLSGLHGWSGHVTRGVRHPIPSITSR